MTPRRLLDRLAARQDLVLVALLVATVGMMILPMPTQVADLLIAVNIGIAMLLMMVAIYIRSPVEFSTLPTVILITTAFRLSISITTSRLVLVQADAGEIIRTFGEFVIAGNVVVGLVVYLIITIVQFVVITKGAERVAEVAARFTLDALPGKQISIDTDLRNGDIDQAEARRRRGSLEKESQLYGAMDGAMKFVKGDAIASLVIIAVNLLGGMAIGCLQRGLSFPDAVRTYSLLAVGDGLIAQIPALLISLTAGVIVTRVTSDGGGDLGHDIIGQLTAEPRTMQIAALALGGLGLVPGFPTAVFLTLGAALGGGAWLLAARKRRSAADAFAAAKAGAREAPEPAKLRVRVGAALDARRPAIEAALEAVRAEAEAALGIAVPKLRVLAAPALPQAGFRIEIDDVPMATGEADPALLWVHGAEAELELLGLAHARRPAPDGGEAVSVDAAAAAELRRAGIEHLDAAGAIAARARAVLLRNAGLLVGIQETQALLGRMEAGYADLLREATKAAPLPRLAELLRHLVEEQVPIGNLRAVLEAVAEWGPREANPALLAEQVRGALKRQICNRWADDTKTLSGLMVEGAVEEALRGALRPGPAGAALALDQAGSERLLASIRAHLAGVADRRVRPVLMTAPDLRRPLRALLLRHGLDVPVLSYGELAGEFGVHVIGTLRLAGAGAARAPGPARDAGPAVLPAAM